MNGLIEWVGAPWIQRLGWTLVHFLWQGTVVMVWFGGTVLLTTRLLAGWIQVLKLRRGAGELAGDEWRHRLAMLRGRLRVSRPARLLESAWVEVPTVIGWLRPVILLPASALTGLTSAQWEAILAHELAHIRRWDYLVNLLQSAVEIVLFYHPGVWWISRCIREERELCCDAMVVEVCGAVTG